MTHKWNYSMGENSEDKVTLSVPQRKAHPLNQLKKNRKGKATFAVYWQGP